ncbi:PIN domain-containing protein [Patescibacteria group bacterium]|nr:PIN domain-containing protein [Patescibacteria group bacterium]MCG2702505.1 PIN domain-containing protein [Candidatus Parcubacteria bacterium]MBU4264558.1 PIN domain-containing protein [Patescibacteria group bacterium]MBU4390226.1 PIN domain-containing protein [Patescibacteria group bacterium]MBU4397143.1 PIN domain-containing protein [Patescibacteria group bacterium]
MKKVLVGTDVIIDFTNGKNRILQDLLEKQKKEKVELYINSVVLTEFFTSKGLEDKEKSRKAKELFSYFRLIEIGSKIAFKTAELLRKKEVDFLGDGYIAGTCLVKELRLITRNKRHFEKVKGLRL